MSDIAVLVYHKNASDIYPQSWIDQFVSSIENQTHSNFDILEMDYGGTSRRLFTRPGFTSTFYGGSYINFIYALNYLISQAREMGYKYILNTNCDDYYDPRRVELQLQALQEYDLVSSNFSLLDEYDRITLTHAFDKLDIQAELDKDHNIIGHPGVAYRSSFFDDFSYNPSEILHEDLKLWQRSIITKKFRILEPVLFFHRVHKNAVCRSNNR